MGEAGFDNAKNFVTNHCLHKKGEVDIDDGQRQGSFGREIGVVYCDGMNLNQASMSNNLAVILTEFCDVSEFSSGIADIFMHNSWGTGMVGFNRPSIDPANPGAGNDQLGLTWINPKEILFRLPH